MLSKGVRSGCRQGVEIAFISGSSNDSCRVPESFIDSHLEKYSAPSYLSINVSHFSNH